MVSLRSTRTRTKTGSESQFSSGMRLPMRTGPTPTYIQAALLDPAGSFKKAHMKLRGKSSAGLRRNQWG